MRTRLLLPQPQGGHLTAQLIQGADVAAAGCGHAGWEVTGDAIPRESLVNDRQLGSPTHTHYWADRDDKCE